MSDEHTRAILGGNIPKNPDAIAAELQASGLPEAAVGAMLQPREDKGGGDDHIGGGDSDIADLARTLPGYHEQCVREGVTPSAAPSQQEGEPSLPEHDDWIPEWVNREPQSSADTTGATIFEFPSGKIRKS